MKRIIDGRLYDDQFMDEIGSRTFDRTDPVTGEMISYRETLLRECVLKPGHTVADTWVKDTYGRKMVKDHCDPMRGRFVLRVARGYGDGVFVPIGDRAARRWFEDYMPGQTDRYAEVFGRPSNPWTDDGVADLVQEAESRASTLEWEKGLAESRAARAEAEAAALRAKLEDGARRRDVVDAAMFGATGNGGEA